MITAVYSDVGKVRKVNEDSYFVSDFKDRCGYIIVADGMGGHNGGQIASRTAIDIIKNTLVVENLVGLSNEKIEDCLNLCINEANKAVLSKSLNDEKLDGMGTTVVICVIIKDDVYIANVGDSRLYAVRKNNIAQITKDHSYVQQLIDMGEITEKEAENHPRKNVITRAVGCDIKVEVDTYHYKAKKDDYILLCTDGLSNMVDNSVILKSITDSKSLQDAVNTLGDIAINNGGYDNITLVAVKFD